MNFDNPILFFLCSIGVFNGVLVSLYFLFFSKPKRIQNLLFGLLVLLLSIRIGKSVYSIFTPRDERDLLILQIGLSACFLIGIALYYYLKASIDNKKSIPKKWKLHFGVLSLFIVIVGFVKPYGYYGDFWNTFFVQFIYVVWGFYIVASGIVLKDIFKKLATLNKKTTTAELWLITVYAANALIFLAYIIGFFHLYLIGTITFSVVFYAMLIFFLSKNNRDTIFQDIPTKYAARKIENKEADFLVDKLDRLMKEKELYKEANVKLLSISKELQITPHKLSQLLNDNIGKSLASFLNDYRIEEAKVLLNEKQNITLEAIGFEAGFSSKSSFYATFKKAVGQTPSQYQKQ